MSAPAGSAPAAAAQPALRQTLLSRGCLRLLLLLLGRDAHHRMPLAVLAAVVSVVGTQAVSRRETAE